jgi:hypothetical protein
MYQIGDEVIIMSAPGTWTVVAIDGDLLTIENTQGLRRQLLSAAVRKRSALAAPRDEG